MAVSVDIVNLLRCICEVIGNSLGLPLECLQLNFNIFLLQRYFLYLPLVFFNLRLLELYKLFLSLK